VGTGLGLPLCLGIVEAHGGALRVDSVPGQGTVVGVELPLMSMPLALPTPEPVALPVVTPKIILVMDDQPGIARALEYFLQRDGHTVEIAANGCLALAKCQGQDYDVILCDLRACPHWTARDSTRSYSATIRICARAWCS
jgi:response regulator receiver domain-containing protein/histidine kinase/DNA gyrase B/HSP90-like ATPase